MIPLECYPSRLRIAGLSGLTCVMVAVSWYCRTSGRVVPIVFGWMGVAFFGLELFVLSRAWFHAGTPAMIVGPDGIEGRQSGYGLIRWEDVAELTVHSIHGIRMLSVHVVDTDAYPARVSAQRRVGAAANPSLGFAPITLEFVGLSPGLDEVLNDIRELPGTPFDSGNAAS